METIISKISNLTYTFNNIANWKEYVKVLYMLKLIAFAWEEIIKVLQTKLKRKDQIKTTLVIYYKYFFKKKDPVTKKITYTFADVYYKGEIQSILLKDDIKKHLTCSEGEINEKINVFLNNRFN